MTTDDRKCEVCGHVVEVGEAYFYDDHRVDPRQYRHRACEPLAEEVKRLRQSNADLLAAAQAVLERHPAESTSAVFNQRIQHLRAAIAAATGGIHV